MKIDVFNRQRVVRIETKRLQLFAEAAFAECLRHSDDARFALRELPAVEVTVVSDAVIARLHRNFMNVPGPTDVITFDHGEIVVSAETARRYARENCIPVFDELGLYVVHGLLHLNGYDDREARARARMRRLQDRIMDRVLAQIPRRRASRHRKE